MLAWLIGSRKLLITLVVFLTSVVLLILGILLPDQWVELNKFVIPSFLAANIAEHVMTRGARDKRNSDS